MAVTKNAQKYSVKVEYKAEYDTAGEYNLPAFNQTFSKVSEAATPDMLKAFADALMSLTIYHGAPYKVRLIDTSELVVA